MGSGRRQYPRSRSGRSEDSCRRLRRCPGRSWGRGGCPNHRRRNPGRTRPDPRPRPGRLLDGRSCEFVDLPPCDLDAAAGVVQVAVDGVDIADDELHEHPAGGLQSFADVGGPGFLVEGLVDTEEVRIGLAREDDVRAAQRLAHHALVAPAGDRDLLEVRQPANVFPKRMCWLAAAVIQQPERLAGIAVVGEAELVEHLRRDAHRLLAVGAAPHVAQACGRGLVTRRRQPGREVVARAEARLVGVVDAEQLVLLRPVHDPHGVVAEVTHQLVHLVRAIVHGCEEGLHAHQFDDVAREHAAGVGTGADAYRQGAAEQVFQERFVAESLFDIEAADRRLEDVQVPPQILDRVRPVVAGLDAFGVLDRMALDLHAAVQVDIGEEADVERVRDDLVVVEQLVVADGAEQLSFDALARLARAAVDALGHEVAVEGPGLDDDRRAGARLGVVEGIPHPLPLSHDGQGGVLGLLLRQFAQVSPLVIGDLPFHCVLRVLSNKGHKDPAEAGTHYALPIFRRTTWCPVFVVLLLLTIGD